MLFNQLIPKICQQENIKVQTLSRGWLFRLEKPAEKPAEQPAESLAESPADKPTNPSIAATDTPTSQVRYIFKGAFTLNSQSSAAIIADKFATFEVFRAAGIPIIDHAILYAFDNHLPFAEGCNTPEYLEDYFNNHDHNIVLKPNRGSCGRGITHITSSAQFPDALAAAFSNSASASLCPFYQARHEYRVIMLDGEPRLVYGKAHNTDWRFNLECGSRVIDVDPSSKLYAQLVALARRAVNILDLRFCSVDIIELDPSKHPATEPQFLIMEVNGAVTTSHYVEQRPSQAALVENIYRDAIRKMFE